MKFIHHKQIPDKHGSMRVRNGEVLVCKELRPCIMCGELTEFVEICSEGRFCSDECMDRFCERLQENEEARAVEDG